MRGAYSRREPREKNHSSHGGRKAYLNFELKDRRPPEAAALRAVLDFKVQTRSGRPCDEWEGVAGAALFRLVGYWREARSLISNGDSGVEGNPMFWNRAWYLIKINGAMRWSTYTRHWQKSERRD